jgi:signal transduction histidine kinase
VSIVLPSILAIVFFILLIFTVILPSSEKNIMDGKKEMISQLTNTSLSLLEEFYQEVLLEDILEDSAKILAAKRIEQVRYGAENKDYFWIIDEQPAMIMHPYRPELMRADLSDYQDPNGKKLFVEAVQIVEQKGD